ncbi:MAG: hypothetical protein JNK04_16445 [Myxococcales bacterium]|nr:hypothetical protein [Myxococcales bacterium]
MWAVQGLLVLGIAFMFLVFAVSYEDALREHGAAFIIWLLISVQTGLLVGIQLRQQWARWITVGLYTLSLLGNVAAFSGHSGARLAGNIVGAVLALALIARFALGAPARRYFARETALPQ